MQKPVVLQSLEDPSGERCVDIRQELDGTYSWMTCRRDPEDSHGWRPLGPAKGRFATQQDALADAKRKVGWLDAV